MKKYSLALTAFCALFSVQVNAATVAGISGINAFVDTATIASGNFLNWQSTVATDTINQSQMTADMTDTNEATWVTSIDPTASIDLGFNVDIFNGEGADLVFFFIGDPAFNFDLNINGIVNNIDNAVLTGFGITDPLNRLWNVSAALVELSDFGFATNEALTSDFRLFIGNDYADPSRPTVSLVGGFHTDPVVVPLPLPIVLFASGIGLLSLFARRKQV